LVEAPGFTEPVELAEFALCWTVEAPEFTGGFKVPAKLAEARGKIAATPKKDVINRCAADTLGCCVFIN
jgi:hypothetical protein